MHPRLWVLYISCVGELEVHGIFNRSLVYREVVDTPSSLLEILVLVM